MYEALLPPSPLTNCLLFHPGVQKLLRFFGEDKARRVQLNTTGESHGQRLLYMAIQAGSVEIVKLLILKVSISHFQPFPAFRAISNRIQPFQPTHMPLVALHLSRTACSQGRAFRRNQTACSAASHTYMMCGNFSTTVDIAQIFNVGDSGSESPLSFSTRRIAG